MKIKDILKTASAVAAPFIPGGPAILAAVNAFLPLDDQVPETATGADILTRVNALPPEQQSSILEKEIDLEIAESNNFSKNLAVLSEVDKVGNSTRPAIAKEMAHILSFSIIVPLVALFVSVFKSNDPLKQLNDIWPMILVLTATPAAVIRAYFGLRTKEKNSRYAASCGTTLQSPLEKIIEVFSKGR